MFCEKVVLKNFVNFTKKHLCCNFIKKRLQHRRFLVKFANFLRTPKHILKNICELLLLKLMTEVLPIEKVLLHFQYYGKIMVKLKTLPCSGVQLFLPVWVFFSCKKSSNSDNQNAEESRIKIKFEWIKQPIPIKKKSNKLVKEGVAILFLDTLYFSFFERRVFRTQSNI